ncbi:MAG: tRNA-dihydrouridine synthase [bacterium]|nr:tRNA-dihydrouridine synthase [bacterium]
MIQGFWKQLKKPITVLAPMADVTDGAFREIIAKYGKPDVMWTEFVSADGLASEKGRKGLLIDFKYCERERPIVAQIFGATPEHFFQAARLAKELGFDGVDINMGCPDKKVLKQGAGAALCKYPALAQELIYKAMKGADGLPVSVKIRLGYGTDVLDEWLPTLLETNLAAVTIHARTMKEMSDVPARWNRIADAVVIRDRIQQGSDKTLILGNGDVKDIAQAHERVKETGCDGVMIGRGIFGNPWLFNADAGDISLEEKLAVMCEHTFLFEKYFANIKSFDVMKKHYKAYVNGFDGAKELRVRLMECKTAKEVQMIVDQFLAEKTSE